MTTSTNSTENTPAPSEKELNFRKQEEMYTRKLEQEREARLAAEQKMAEYEKERAAQARLPYKDTDEDDDDEPYVDRKKLKKELVKSKQELRGETESIIKNEVQSALANERKANWLRSNPDFQEVMSHAQKFVDKYPATAETILELPEGFERQKLVYNAIKEAGLHKKEEAKPPIQDVINKNQRNPYYQPSGVGTAPYGVTSVGGKDYSSTDQKNAYAKMKELQAKLRL